MILIFENSYYKCFLLSTKKFYPNYIYLQIYFFIFHLEIHCNFSPGRHATNAGCFIKTALNRREHVDFFFFLARQTKKKKEETGVLEGQLVWNMRWEKYSGGLMESSENEKTCKNHHNCSLFLCKYMHIK